jgi:hypothetical protein
MQTLTITDLAHNPNAHTPDEILSGLRGTSGGRRWSFRYELLTSANVYVKDLSIVTKCTVDQNWLADIKRTAQFTIRDTGEINYLQDRIKPWVRLHLPPYGDNDWVEWPQGVFLLSSPTRTVDETKAVFRDVQGYDQLQEYADDKVSTRYTVDTTTTITEDFEDDDLQVQAMGSWARASDQYHAGSSSLKSATIGANSRTDMTVLVPTGATSMIVWYKVSSEADYDYFRIFKDGVQQVAAAGEVDWTDAEIDVTGASTIVFRYEKDELTTGGDDAAWIDDLVFYGASTKYTDVVSELLGSIDKQVTTSTSVVTTAKEWEPGTAKLKIINELLSAINYQSLSFDENGIAIVAPYTAPSSRAAEYTYADDTDSIMLPKVDQTLDLFDVANSWTLVVSDPDKDMLTSTYTNVDPASPTSTVNRQRTIVDFRTETDAADQTTLDAKVARLAFEASQVYEHITFDTGLMPIHSGNDVYKIVYSPLAVNAIYAEHTWSMQLDLTTTMKHTVRRVVSV